MRLAEEHIIQEHCSIEAASRRWPPKTGVSPHTLPSWLKASRTTHQPTTDMTREELAAEVRQLRAKLTEMQRANEILKTASAFFAAELDRPGPYLIRFIDEDQGSLRPRLICRTLREHLEGGIITSRTYRYAKTRGTAYAQYS